MSESIFHCQSPLRIRNPYTHEWCWVPCRKCASCRSRKIQEWTSRLNIESRCHPYQLFGTLTYAPKYLPYYEVDWNRKVLFSTKENVEFKFVDLPLDKNSYEYLKCRRCLPVADSAEVQKFIKRVRERIRTNQSGERADDRYLRYYLVSDFGSTVLRPHYHFIFYTGSKWFAENAKSVVSECWRTDNRNSESESLGYSKVEHVLTSASSYVASYVNCFEHLPQIYTFRKFKPFSLCSRHPPLGTLFENAGEIKELFNSGSCTRSVWNRKQNEFLDVPLPKSLCDRLYPRIKGFGSLPFDVLCRLYSRASECTGAGFDWFEHCIKAYCIGYKDELSEYFKDLYYNDSDNHSALHSLYATLSRFHFQRNIFGVSVDDYVRRIVEFYKSRDLLMLNAQCKWQERVSKECSPTLSLFVDFDLVSSLRTDYQSFFDITDYDEMIDYLKKYALYFKRDAFSPQVLDKMLPSDDPETAKSWELSNKVVSDGKKKHEKNDYLRRADIDDDLRQFLIYFNSVKHGCKKCD